jgi:N-hydroxyarylamine O-acetyltransferase
MDIEAYLRRINYHGSLAATGETLQELQVAHLLAVPFENLSIHSGEPIILDDDALFEKIVVRRRGGFCYELNGLFAALLGELGFEVAMLSARVANAQGTFGPDFDHMTLLVALDEDERGDRWPSTPAGLPRRGPRLADVGFGDSFREPLLLDSRQEQAQGERAYKIVADGPHLILMQRESDGGWKAQYRFTLQPHEYADYVEMCRYHQTSPNSHFTRARVCTRATLEGRVTLSEMRLITTIQGQERTERLLTNDAEYASVLNEHFGVVMNR